MMRASSNDGESCRDTDDDAVVSVTRGYRALSGTDDQALVSGSYCEGRRPKSPVAGSRCILPSAPFSTFS